MSDLTKGGQAPAPRKGMPSPRLDEAEFKRRYRDELAHNPALADVRGKLGKGKVTLLYAARDPAINQAVVLAEVLRRARPNTRKRAVARPQRASRSRRS